MNTKTRRAVFFSILALVFVGFTGGMLISRTPQRFGIYVGSFNNEKYCEWNLKSILDQEYDNFYVVYMNDQSSDRTLEMVREIVKKHPKGDLVTIIDNEVRKRPCGNYVTAIEKHAEDDDVIVIVDGDDALDNDQVLKTLNRAYNKYRPEVWLTYGQYREKNSGNIGFCRPFPSAVVKNNAFRKFDDIPSHLKTFKAWLFKRIAKEDLMTNGEYMPMSWDLTSMMPMIEMAAHRHKFIKEVLYTYNDNNAISEHFVSKHKQMWVDRLVRGRQPYRPLYHNPKTYCLRSDCVLCQEKFGYEE
ncbi:MAG: glycosyltransferase family 2 protein [Simkaniaceae bacterium]|nr:glycosyltransferase family 2 protein [Simkaniaceae bacterium]